MNTIIWMKPEDCWVAGQVPFNMEQARQHQATFEYEGGWPTGWYPVLGWTNDNAPEYPGLVLDESPEVMWAALVTDTRIPVLYVQDRDNIPDRMHPLNTFNQIWPG